MFNTLEDLLIALICFMFGVLLGGWVKTYLNSKGSKNSDNPMDTILDKLEEITGTSKLDLDDMRTDAVSFVYHIVEVPSKIPGYDPGRRSFVITLYPKRDFILPTLDIIALLILKYNDLKEVISIEYAAACYEISDLVQLLDNNSKIWNKLVFDTCFMLNSNPVCPNILSSSSILLYDNQVNPPEHSVCVQLEKNTGVLTTYSNEHKTAIPYPYTLYLMVTVWEKKK